jgi:hypothetical protein
MMFIPQATRSHVRTAVRAFFRISDFKPWGAFMIELVLGLLFAVFVILSVSNGNADDQNLDRRFSTLTALFRP